MKKVTVEEVYLKGFTLIELLVVIAIIAILAVILFPVFAQAREKARAITCLSNQKQIGLAITMYIQDYDETFPMDQYDTSVSGGIPDDNTLRFWTDFVYPYIKNGDRAKDPVSGQPITWGVGGVFSCPSFPDPNQSAQIGANYGIMPDGACSWNPVASPVVSLAAITTPQIRCCSPNWAAMTLPGDGASFSRMRATGPIRSATRQVAWIHTTTCAMTAMRRPHQGLVLSRAAVASHGTAIAIPPI